MIERIREYCVADESWKTVREVILQQCSHIREVVQLLVRLCLNLESITEDATVGPWSVTATLTLDSTTAEPRIGITMEGSALEITDTWKGTERAASYWQFLRTNPADPWAIAALIQAFQELLGALDTHVTQELQRLDDDQDYRSARALIEAVVVSRSLANEHSRKS